LLLFLYQIVQGFIDLSEKKIMHLDLKPDNILIQRPNEYLICDFGCSKVVQDLAVSKNFLKMSQSKGLGTA
jgi:serine/threonine protein kinase